jgi:hypothetical protein
VSVLTAVCVGITDDVVFVVIDGQAAALSGHASA